MLAPSEEPAPAAEPVAEAAQYVAPPPLPAASTLAAAADALRLHASGSACGLRGHIRVSFANLPPPACAISSVPNANSI
jgi:hypothetical protein